MIVVLTVGELDKELSGSLSTLHLHFLKGTLGIKRTATNWAILSESEMSCSSY